MPNFRPTGETMQELARIRSDKHRELAKTPKPLTQEEIDDAVRDGFFKLELLGRGEDGRVTYGNLPIEDLKRLDDLPGDCRFK